VIELARRHYRREAESPPWSPRKTEPWSRRRNSSKDRPGAIRVTGAPLMLREAGIEIERLSCRPRNHCLRVRGPMRRPRATVGEAGSQAAKESAPKDDWITHSHDPDARAAHEDERRADALAHKAEHAVDMETGAIVAVTLHGADEGDTQTISRIRWPRRASGSRRW